MKEITESQLKKDLRELPSRADGEWFERTMHNLEVYAMVEEGVTEGPESRIHPMLYKFYTSLQMSSGTKIIAVVLASVAGLLLLGGGVAMAADPAKPGDALYGVDLAVESVQRSLKFGDAAKADFEIDVLDERMEELAELDEEEGDLGDALEEVDEQQDRLYTQVRKMEENNDVDEGEKERVWTRYESRYEYHYEYMKQLQEKQEGQGTGSGNGAGTGSGGSDDTEEESDVLLNSITDDFQSGGPDFDGPGNYIQKQDRDQMSTPEDPGGQQTGPQHGIE